MNTTITTRSRKLEQFYYAHGVDWVRTYYDDEGMHVWEYANNEENQRILEEFKIGLARRTKKGV